MSPRPNDQITVTPNGHMLKPMSYPYGLLSGFLICLLDRINESIYCIIHAHISWTASLAWMHQVIVLQLFSFSIQVLYAAMCDCVLVHTFAICRVYLLSMCCAYLLQFKCDCGFLFCTRLIGSSYILHTILLLFFVMSIMNVTIVSLKKYESECECKCKCKCECECGYECEWEWEWEWDITLLNLWQQCQLNLK